MNTNLIKVQVYIKGELRSDRYTPEDSKCENSETPYVFSPLLYLRLVDQWNREDKVVGLEVYPLVESDIACVFYKYVESFSEIEQLLTEQGNWIVKGTRGLSRFLKATRMASNRSLVGHSMRAVWLAPKANKQTIRSELVYDIARIECQVTLDWILNVFDRNLGERNRTWYNGVETDW